MLYEVITNVDDLLAQAGKKGVPFQGRTIFFDPAAVILVEHDPGFRHRVLSWLIDPQIAYFLLLGGMAGLFFELTTPGAILPGVLGGLCLLLGLYAMSVLPTNVAGLLVVIFGVVLFRITSYNVCYTKLLRLPLRKMRPAITSSPSSCSQQTCRPRPWRRAFRTCTP